MEIKGKINKKLPSRALSKFDDDNIFLDRNFRSWGREMPRRQFAVIFIAFGFIGKQLSNAHT